MKKPKRSLLLLLLLLQQILVAQVVQKKSSSSNDAAVEEVRLNARQEIYTSSAQNQLVITNLKPDEYDRAAVVNMQGAVVLKQSVNATLLRLDISNLVDGLYLLVLHSSASLKEKSVKFVVKR